MKMAGDTPHPRPLSQWERGDRDPSRGRGEGLFSELRSEAISRPEIASSSASGGLLAVTGEKLFAHPLRGKSRVPLILYFHYHFYLDARAVGARALFQPHRGPGMAAPFAVEIAQKVGGAIGHSGMVTEPGNRVDHAQ